jgi:putative CocE/NonD family hydrolase
MTVAPDAGLRIPMRDGAELAADLYLPGGVAEPRGTVLVRTPYDRAVWRPGAKGADEAELFAGEGFAVVVQDVRGTGGSDGEFHVFRHERDDGWDTVDWIARQPWSNRRVGTFGCSYLGEVQLLLAATRHPCHVAMVPMASAGALHEFGARVGGAVDLLDTVAYFASHGATRERRSRPEIDVARAVWTLPPSRAIADAGGPASDFEQIVLSEPGDAWWTEVTRQVTDDDRFDVPALLLDSWYDQRPAKTLALAERLRATSCSLRARRNQFVVIAPGTHCAWSKLRERTLVGELDVGDARFPLERLWVAWFQHWLDADEPGDFPLAPLTYYTIGANAWRTAPAWPPPGGASLTLALDGDGDAAQPGRAGRLVRGTVDEDGHDAYVYDPEDPCPTLGGLSYYPGLGVAGAADQRPLLARPDVAVYLGDVLAHELEVTGEPHAVICFSSSAEDTDLVLKLLDVDPGGRALNVAQAILRLRYRDGLTRPRALVPGEPERVTVELGAVSYRLAAGHRIGLLVTSSNFPAHDRNTNTNLPLDRAAHCLRATNRIHHGPSARSELHLPIAAAAPACDT